MKTCNTCGQCKPLDAFNKKKDSRDGYRAKCKTCKAAELREWRARNPDATREKTRTYYAKVLRPWFKRRYVENKERIAAASRTWRKENPDKHSAKEARRRFAKRSASPAWADDEKIKAVYAEAAALRALGLDVHVDHIYPLKGATVCGLHVHWNLQILLAEDNLKKHNRHPDDTAYP